MKFIKRHKVKLILIGAFILIFIVATIALISIIYPDYKKDVYGNRLKDITEYKVSNQVIDEIIGKMEDTSFVKDANYNLKGRLMYFNILVNADTNVAEAKKLVDNIKTVLAEDIQKYYDIQVMIKEDREEAVENSHYPIFAYQHKSKDNFVWTNN